MAPRASYHYDPEKGVVEDVIDREERERQEEAQVRHLAELKKKWDAYQDEQAKLHTGLYL